MGQVVLQIIAGIAKQVNFYYKGGQLLQSTKEKREKRGKTIDFGNVVLYSPLDLPCDKRFIPRISWKV